MKRILIIQTAFIGDVILATAMIESLHQEFGESCKIDVVVRKGNEGLLKKHPFVYHCFVWDKKSGKYKQLFKLIKEIRQTTYDIVYNLQRFASTGFITFRAKAKVKVGFKKNPFSSFFSRKVTHQIGNGKHEVNRNFELIRPDLNKVTKTALPKLYPSDLDHEKVKESVSHINEYRVFAPASVWFTKQLPKHKWVELGKKVSNDEYILFIGAPNDSALIDEIIANLPTQNCLNMAGKLTLLQSALLMQSAKRTYVNDSAPLHLASAVNAPVTAFFCSTVPDFGFGPLSTDKEIQQVAEPLSCRPCGLHGYKACPKGHFKCGNELELHL